MKKHPFILLALLACVVACVLSIFKSDYEDLI